MAILNNYAMKAKCYGVAIRAGVNGSLTLVDLKGEGKMVYRQVNDWIRPEKNSLTGLLFLPPGGSLPDGTRAPTPDAFLQISIYVPDELGEPVVGVPPLAAFRWPLPIGPRVVPMPFTIPFKIAEPIPTRLWSVAAVVDSLTNVDRAEIVALVNRLRAVMAAGDGVGVYEMMQLRYDDEAIAEGFSIADMKQVVVEQSGAFGHFTRGQPDLDVLSAGLTLVAGGQLYLITRGAMQSAITFEDDETKLSIDVYAAKVNGTWVVGR